MTAEQFSAQVGQVFQAEWRRARRRALATAFTLGMIMGLLFGAYHAELSQIWGGGEMMTNQLLIDSPPLRPLAGD